jgi:hypothetical protein
MGMNFPNVRPRVRFFQVKRYFRLNRWPVRVIAAICVITFCAGVGVRADSGHIFAGAADNGRFLWKLVGRAQLKLEDKTPLQWNVYQTEKKKEANLVLVQLGRRFVALDIRGKIAYYVFPSDLQAKGPDFESGNLFVQSRLMPTTAWTVRDVGPAEMIKLTLGDYGRALDVELPHMPDLRAFY